METEITDKQNTPESGSDAPTCSLMLILERELDRYQPHTNCRRAIQRTIDACKEVGLLTSGASVQTASTEPETDACYARAGMMLVNQVDELDATCRKLENERNAALRRERAIITFLETEMNWNYFRAEMSIGDNPTISEQNAIKLRKYLKENIQARAAQSDRA